jgi:hypothetical protein
MPNLFDEAADAILAARRDQSGRPTMVITSSPTS